MIAMARSEPGVGWARWALLAGMLAAALALVGAAWASRASVLDAADTLARGQAEAVLDDVRRELRDAARRPDAELMAEILAKYQSRGLRYLAFATPGDAVDAGARIGGPPRARHGRGPFVEVLRTRGRVRVVAPMPPPGRELAPPGERGPPPREGPPPPERGPPPAIVVELEPLEANRLAASAARTLYTSGGGALLLVIAAVLAFRWLTVRERESVARARERHLASLGEMSAVLAHELRNPLASLKGNAQLLAESAEPKQKARADVVVDEAVRLEGLTASLLELVRTGAIERRASSPAEVLRLAASDVDLARIDLDVERAPATWRLDAERMRQVLGNVLRNAAQAGEGRIAARMWSEAGSLRIEVRDRGPGFAPGVKLFEPFHTTKTRGTGLGLAVARRIVELHGGTIRAANHPDGGAIVEIALPEQR
jgi:two-component system, NtrC family, sensor histidine kinase HydH